MIKNSVNNYCNTYSSISCFRVLYFKDDRINLLIIARKLV